MPEVDGDIHQRFIITQTCVLLQDSSYNTVTAVTFTLIRFLISKHFSRFTVKYVYYGFYEIIRTAILLPTQNFNISQLW